LALVVASVLGLATLALLQPIENPTHLGMHVKLLTITRLQFTPNNALTLALKNTGTEPVTIFKASVNDLIAYWDEPYEPSFQPGETGVLTLNYAWTNQNTCNVTLYDHTNQVLGTFQKEAALPNA
jgi:hypothetical protein